MQYDESDEQYSVLPCAIANKVGNLHKSNKSNWSDQVRLIRSTIFYIQSTIAPKVVINDAKIMLNIRSLWQTKTMSDYNKLLLIRFALQHYKTGVNEVHLMFNKQE